MESRAIGSLTVSVVGLGCNNFGSRIDEAATKRVVDAALDAGINFFDTADIYGGTKSEEFLGRALKGKRGRAVIATKFGAKVDEDRKGAKPDYVRRAVEDSLRRLDVETIDLYQLHTPDTETPVADTLGALNNLVKAGKVREIGCSNFSVQQLHKAETAAEGKARFVSVQNEYSLFHREPELDVSQVCAQLRMALIPYFPLASGLLTGKYRLERPLPEGTRLSKETDRGKKVLSRENLEVVETLIRFAEDRGHTLLELAFGWLLAHPVVSSVIAGATKPEQVTANAAAPRWQLTPAEVAAVKTLLPAIAPKDRDRAE